jgi:hypothetical protein
MHSPHSLLLVVAIKKGMFIGKRTIELCWMDMLCIDAKCSSLGKKGQVQFVNNMHFLEI